jgi:hypothetical protein
MELIKSALEKLPDPALRLVCGEMSDFLTKVTSVRHALVHMSSTNKLAVEEARISMFLVNKLIVLYCIFEAQDLGFSLDKVENVLQENSFARGALRPLP